MTRSLDPCADHDKVMCSECQLYDELFQKVKNHMGWDDKKTTTWFLMDNPWLGEMAPVNFLMLRPEKCARWIEALIEQGYTGHLYFDGENWLTHDEWSLKYD